MTATVQQTTYRDYRITSTFSGQRAAPWSEGSKAGPNYAHHKVSVRNVKTSKVATFDYWGSLAEQEIRGRDDLLSAFEAWLSDGAAGLESFEDFCGEFGYDTDSRKAETTWKACQKSGRQVEWIIEEDIYDFANQLREDENL